MENWSHIPPLLFQWTHMLQARERAEVQERKVLRNYPFFTEMIVWLGDEAYRMEGLSKPNAQSTGCQCL